MKQAKGLDPNPPQAFKPKQMSTPNIDNKFAGFGMSEKNFSGAHQTQTILTEASSTTTRTFSQNNLKVAVPTPLGQKTVSQEKKQTPAKSGASKKKSRKKKNDKRNRERLSGRLKFFDEGRKYGFFVIDQTEQDMFVHYDDLKKTMIPKNLLSSCKNRYSMHFTFHVFEYNGKKKASEKAVDIKLVSIYKIDESENKEIPEPVLLAKDLDPSQINETFLSTFFNS